MSKLVEGEDFYYNAQGYVVFTAKYHLKKGTCCGNGCKHCPYDYIAVEEPRRSELRKQNNFNKQSYSLKRKPTARFLQPKRLYLPKQGQLLPLILFLKMFMM